MDNNIQNFKHQIDKLQNQNDEIYNIYQSKLDKLNNKIIILTSETEEKTKSTNKEIEILGRKIYNIFKESEDYKEFMSNIPEYLEYEIKCKLEEAIIFTNKKYKYFIYNTSKPEFSGVSKYEGLNSHHVIDLTTLKFIR